MRPDASQTAQKQEQPAQEELQPNLVLPEENYDDHPLMKKYASISEQALKNIKPGLEEDDSDDSLQARVG
jgi:hypothetical protein